MPISLANLFRVVVVLVMAVHVFHMYCLARMMDEGVGLELSTVIRSASFAMVMMIPLAWAVALPELPEIVTRFRSHQRWRRGQCSRCGYQLTGIERSTCPECDAARREPEGYDLGWPTVRRFLLLVVLAWALGSTAAELWTWDDERRFGEEVQRHLTAGQDGDYSRARRWPSENGGLVYDPERGILAHD